MRKSMIYILILLFLLTTGAFSQDYYLNYHGVLRQSNGKAVSDGTYNLTFRIYNDDQYGSELWSSTHYNVPVNDGVFNVSLGSETGLNLSFDEQYWVGVSVNGGSEIDPRTPLNAAPYALALKGNDNVFPGSGNVGIGTTDPDKQLSVQGDMDISGNANFSNIDLQEISGNAEIEKRLKIGQGVIQRGGTDIITNSSNLGLYSMVDGDAIRCVTNEGGIRFYTDIGDDSTGANKVFEIKSSGDIEINENTPMIVKNYSPSSARSQTISTGMSTDEWSAVIAGYDYGICDIDEDNEHESWKTICVKDGGQWKVELRGHTHEDHPDWDIDVMFIRKELVDDQRIGF